VPTLNENFSEWRVEAIVMQGEVEAHGIKAIRSLNRSFRFDLASMQANVIFEPSDNATLVRRYSPSLPFHNLQFPLEKKDPSSRIHHSASGAVLVDNTAKRLLNFYEVMFAAVPVVCGCFIRNTVSFPNSFIPLSITERATRTAPASFEDATDGSNNVWIRLNGVVLYRIDLEKREDYSAVKWVSMYNISNQ
jgi:hypothetical protein